MSSFLGCFGADPLHPPEVRRLGRSVPARSWSASPPLYSPLFHLSSLLIHTHREALSASRQTSPMVFFLAVPVMPSNLKARHRDCAAKPRHPTSTGKPPARHWLS